VNLEPTGTDPIKVLFVATAYPRFPGDVITPWMVQLIRRLRDSGIEVSVFTSSYMGLGNQVRDGVPVYRFRYFFRKYERLTHDQTAVDRFSQGPRGVLLSFLYVLFGTAAIVRLVRARKFHIVHVHWPFPHIVFGLAAKAAARVRVFSTFYGLEIRWLKKKFPYLVRPFAQLIRKSDEVTAISRDTARELAGIVKKDVPIVPFSVALGERPAAAEDRNEILFVGRLVERKGLPVLIDAFRDVQESIPHDLVIVGDGPERPAIEERIRRLGLGSRVRVTGWVSAPEKDEYYRRCSFFVLPAVYDKHGDIEGLGVVMLEAMAFSKPVIASNAGGITDVVEDGVNGVLVPPGDAPALARALLAMAKDEGARRRMGRNAKITVDEKFNWDKITMRLVRLYEKYR
jgi:glycosyltransferase involved in cell wall biosynthesis